jgi:hypothetical protein
VAGVAGFLIVRHFGASLPFIRRWKRVTDKHEPVEQPVMADGGEEQESDERDSSQQRPVEPAE